MERSLHAACLVAAIASAAVAAYAAPPSGSGRPPHRPVPRAVHASSAQPAFDRLAARFIAESERRDPLFADQVGIHVYDDSLADYSPRGHAARIAWLRGWRHRIARAAQARPAGDNADAKALLDTIDLELFEDATVKPVHTDPTYYTGVIGQAMYSLIGRHYAAPGERLRHAAPRLRRIPTIVRDAETMLRRPPRVITLQAIDENAGNIALYTSLRAEAKSASPATQRAIRRELPAALASLHAFSAYLHGTLLPRSNGNPRVGAAVFDRELQLADGTDETRAQLVADAQADFERNREQMLQLAHSVRPAFLSQTTSPMRRARTPPTSSCAAYSTVSQTAIRPGRRSLRRPKATSTLLSGFSPQPASLRCLCHPSLDVVPTPAFMAGFAGAALDPAGPVHAAWQSRTFTSTRFPPAWSRARVTSYLRDFNDYEMQMLSFHEAVPGHYVQFRYNDRVPSIVRRVLPSGSFAEGWAVYGEGMMLDAGFGGNDPALRLFQLKWRLREEANTIIDAAFHTGDLNEGRCDDLLERQAFQDRSEALTKWHRLQLSHDQLTSYFVGLDAIRRAEAAQRARLGSSFDVAKFNAALLHMGSVEPRFIGVLLGDNAGS